MTPREWLDAIGARLRELAVDSGPIVHDIGKATYDPETKTITATVPVMNEAMAKLAREQAAKNQPT